MSMYLVQTIYEGNSDTNSWITDLTPEQEAEILEKQDNSQWVTVSDLTFGEADLSVVALPVTGTIAGEFILYHD